MQRALGIDLGTTNSVVAFVRKGVPQIIVNRENSELTPSVVGIGRRGDLLVGSQAKARELLPQSIASISSVKRFMGRRFADPVVQNAISRMAYRVTEGADGDVRVWLGERDYSPTEISSLILRRLKLDAEERLGEPFTRAVITVPAYFGERQVAATQQAGRDAGFHVLRIINEPTAAALAFGLNREDDDEGKIVLVYDLGGGTFDISILMLMQGAFTVMGIEGHNLLGGDDFDRLIVDRLIEDAQRRDGIDFSSEPTALPHLRQAAEKAKIALSQQQAYDLMVPALGNSHINLESELTRNDFEELIRGHIEHTLELTEKAIREASLTPENIDYVLLVGGSTAIPMVSTMLGKVFGPEKIRREVNPMQCVALGAAIQTALISELQCPECYATNALSDDRCASCQFPLFGLERIGCASCFVLSGVTEDFCWKCGEALSSAEAPSGEITTAETKSAVPSQAIPTSVSPARCPTCGKPYRPGSTTCTICDVQPSDSGGLQCPHCSEINPPGVTMCVRCGKEMSIIVDITPKDLGIELGDGRFAVIIPKNTTYPTAEMVSREFYTVETGQPRIEVFVYEGDQPVARQNELCGVITVPLPKDTPRNTPISIGFGLDADRTTTVAVTVRSAGGEARRTRLERSRLDPEWQRRIGECRDKLTALLDRWTQELSDAEQSDLLSWMGELDTLLSGQSVSGNSALESTVGRIERAVELASEIRGSDAWITNTLLSIGKYLAEDERNKFVDLVKKIEEARRKADWAAGEALFPLIDASIRGLPPGIRLIERCRTALGQNRLSPALASRVSTALAKVDRGVDTNSPEQLSDGLEELAALHDEVDDELVAARLPTRVNTRLQEKPH